MPFLTLRRRFVLLAAACCTVHVAVAAPPPEGCDPGVLACQALGGFVASAVRINVTRKDANTAYQGVRTTIRLFNHGPRPLVLAYREGSSRVSDDNGNVYGWRRAEVAGIGVVSRGKADAQFVLASGESREFSVDGVLQYSRARTVAGNVFTHDLTLVEMQPISPTQVRMVRDHLLSFTNLTGGRP
ncbi:MAG: hypothetical protein WC760_13735 [Bacteroidia bacterium]|jgi:hypothetical protein